MTSKRERYERANIRGGMGVRQKLSEESLRSSFKLNGIQTGSVVARAHDRYRGDFTRGFDTGVLLRKRGDTVTIHWVGEDEPSNYTQGDARYEVERGRWKFLGIMQGNPLDEQNPLLDALTQLRGEYRVQALADADDPAPLTGGLKTEETEEAQVAKELSKAAEERAAAQKQLSAGDLKSRETYSAKQVATRCGTDSKTMRKFFRSNNSTVEAVGQGGRYEFDSKDFPRIKREFDAWHNKSKARQTKPTPKPTVPITEVMDKAKSEYMQGQKVEQPAWVTDPVEVDPPKGFGGIDRYGPNDPDVLPSFEVLDDEPTDEEIAALEDEDLDLDD